MTGGDEVMLEINALISKLPEHEQQDVRELSENILFMRRRLKETRIGLEGQPVVIPYDNGGGQTGIRANPAYGEYEKLLKTYQSAIMCLRQVLGIEQQQPAEQKPKSNLSSMRSKFKVVAG